MAMVISPKASTGLVPVARGFGNDSQRRTAPTPIYLPPTFIALLLLLKPVDAAYRLLQFCGASQASYSTQQQ